MRTASWRSHAGTSVAAAPSAAPVRSCLRERGRSARLRATYAPSLTLPRCQKTATGEGTRRFGPLPRERFLRTGEGEGGGGGGTKLREPYSTASATARNASICIAWRLRVFTGGPRQ